MISLNIIFIFKQIKNIKYHTKKYYDLDIINNNIFLIKRINYIIFIKI